MRPEQILPLLIPFAAFLVPIVIVGLSILTKHQREMAVLLRGGQTAESDRLAALEREMAAMRETLQRQTILLDNLASKQSAEAPLRERISG